MNNRISEGTESAARLLRLPVRQMTPDPYLLHRTHRVDTHDLGADDGVSVGGCCNHDCEENDKKRRTFFRRLWKFILPWN